MLPFKPEPLEILKARFPKCLEKIWTMAEIYADDRPGLYRDYVFDFASGVRLLISRDCFSKHDGTVTHVSASFEYDPPINFQIMETKVIDHFQQLGGRGTLNFLGFSPTNPGKGIPHWITKE